MRVTATALGVTVVALLGIAIIACHSDSAFQSCGDPKILPTARLTLGPSDALSARIRANENHVRSVADAQALFASALPSSGPVMMQPAPDGGTLHDEIDAFVQGTDFTKEELVFFGDQFIGSDGFIGKLSRPGTTVLVSAAKCGVSGGAVQATTEWVAVYRVPLSDTVRMMGCGECGPPPPCCPP